MADVRIAALTKSFGGTPILRGVDLAVPSGALFAILGASGSGKTTLLRLLSGFERADSGDDRDRRATGIRSGRPRCRRRSGRSAMSPQEGSLFPHLSVADNVVFGLPRRERRDRFKAEALLESVGLPASYAEPRAARALGRRAAARRAGPRARAAAKAGAPRRALLGPRRRPADRNPPGGRGDLAGRGSDRAVGDARSVGSAVDGP